MPLRYTRSRGSVGGEDYIAMAKQLPVIFNQELSVAGEQGKAEGQAYIGIAGTQRQWNGNFKGRTAANRGRIDTGEMQDAFDFRVTRGNGVGLDVGWTSKYKEYYGAQDEGFSAGGFRPSQTVEGMGAMAHMRFYMRGKVDSAIDRAVERIVNGL